MPEFKDPIGAAGIMKLAFAPVLFVTLHLSAQNADKVSFHVTSVQQGDATDYCTTGKCSATRFTVEGYTQDKDAAVEFVLDCVEVIANEPTPHTTFRCPRVHSHNDYSVKLGADFVAFGDGSASQTEPIELAYKIKSEREVRKK
jgi:hypothetical protein